MEVEKFRQFLSIEKKKTIKGEETLTEGAIKARISRAGRIEKELNVNLDNAVIDIDNLKNIKKILKDNYPQSVSSTLYNTVTRYYKFKHGEEPEKKHKEYLKI